MVLCINTFSFLFSSSIFSCQNTTQIRHTSCIFAFLRQAIGSLTHFSCKYILSSQVTKHSLDSSDTPFFYLFFFSSVLARWVIKMRKRCHQGTATVHVFFFFFMCTSTSLSVLPRSCLTRVDLFFLFSIFFLYSVHYPPSPSRGRTLDPQYYAKIKVRKKKEKGKRKKEKSQREEKQSIYRQK